MATHSSTLAWKIPWMRSLVGYSPWDCKESDKTERLHFHFSLFTFMHWGKKWQPTPVFLPGESQGWGTWWAAVYGVTQSQTRLKWLSSSRSNTWLKAIYSLSQLLVWAEPEVSQATEIRCNWNQMEAEAMLIWSFLWGGISHGWQLMLTAESSARAARLAPAPMAFPHGLEVS